MGETGENETAYSLLMRGRSLLEDENPAQAVVVLERARAAEPQKGSILEALGRAQFACGRYRKAARSFTDALDVDPTNDYAHYCLGLCYLKMNRKREAGGHFKLAWYLRPQGIYLDKAARFGA